jgi:hypothetical protein
MNQTQLDTAGGAGLTNPKARVSPWDQNGSTGDPSRQSGSVHRAR